MKKVVIGLFVLVSSFAKIKAQESNVLSAYEYMAVYASEKKNGNMGVAIENLVRAKEAIDAASVNEKTMFKSKTWKRRADIYVKLFQEKDAQLTGNKADYLNTAYESVIKAATVEMDPKTNKAKITEGDDMKQRTASYLADTLVRIATANFNNKDYKAAGNAFEKRYNLLKSLGIIDTVTYTNMFLAAYKDSSYDKALVIGNDLIKMNYPDPNLYGTMARIYVDRGENDKGLQLIKDARVKYPKNTEFITEELNYYLTNKDDINAAKVMNEAFDVFKDDPKMLKALYFNSGVIYSNMKDLPKSREYYEKALAIDGKYFAALNNLASSYLDEANILIKQASDLPLKEKVKYEQLKNQSNELYKKAGTLLETAYETKAAEVADPQNSKWKPTYEKQLLSLKKALYELYMKLEDYDKMDKYKVD